MECGLATKRWGTEGANARSGPWEVLKVVILDEIQFTCVDCMCQLQIGLLVLLSCLHFCNLYSTMKQSQKKATLSNKMVTPTSGAYLQKKAEVSKVIVKEERRKASANSVAYAQFLVCPYDSDEIVHAPSPVPVRETTVRQNIVVDLAQYNNAGAFFLEVCPRLTDTLSVTASSTDTQDQGSLCFDMSWFGLTSATRANQGTLTHATTAWQENMRSITGVSGARFGFDVNQSANPITWNYTLTPDSPLDMQLTWSIDTLAAGGSWTSGSSFTSVGGMDASPVTGTVTTPANCLGIGVTCSQSALSYAVPVTAKLVLSYSSGTGTIGLGKETQTCQTFGTPLASSINQLQSWRVTAQDVLVTFEGDTLNDGGSIASARVPSRWSSINADGNPYSDIIALPYDRYDGPLKKGTHVHWLPGAIDDLQPVNSVLEDTQFGYFKMVVAGTITHPGASVRVRVCTTIAYFSTNPSYGSMQWAPPPTDLGLLLQYVARVVPAATENDTHTIKKLAAFAGKHLKSGFQYLLENPEQIAKLASLAAALLG